MSDSIRRKKQTLMSALDADAMDKVSAGVNLGRALRADAQIRFGRNGRRKMMSDSIRRKKQTLMSALDADAIDKVQKNTCIIERDSIAPRRKRRSGTINMPRRDAIAMGGDGIAGNCQEAAELNTCAQIRFGRNGRRNGQCPCQH